MIAELIMNKQLNQIDNQTVQCNKKLEFNYTFSLLKDKNRVRL